MDRADRGGGAFQDGVDVLQRTAGDHRQPPVQARGEPLQQPRPPGLWLDVFWARLDRGQGAVQVEEQGGVIHLLQARWAWQVKGGGRRHVR